MKVALIIAKFIGKDGSLGYKRGKFYPLLVSRLGWFERLIRPWTLEIQRIDGTGYCPYSTEGTFLKNWLIVPQGKYVVEIEQLKEEEDWA